MTVSLHHFETGTKRRAGEEVKLLESKPNGSSRAISTPDSWKPYSVRLRGSQSNHLYVLAETTRERLSAFDSLIV